MQDLNKNLYKVISEPGRIDRITYYMLQAELVKLRGTCKKQQVGCILTHDNRIISTGYNSSHPGTPHCAENVENCLSDKMGRCRKVMHAEISALSELKDNYKGKGFIAYLTHHPCSQCYQALSLWGCKTIYYRLKYFSNEDDERLFYALQADIKTPTIQVIFDDSLFKIQLKDDFEIFNQKP